MVTNTAFVGAFGGRAEKQHPLCLFPLGGVPAPAHAAHLPLCSGSPVCPICAPPGGQHSRHACRQHHFPEDHVCPPSLRLYPTQSVGCYATLLASWHARGGHGGHLHIISDMRMTISGTRFPLKFPFFTFSIQVHLNFVMVYPLEPV